MKDDLTGVASKNHFFHRFDEYLKLARREGMWLVLLLVDLEHLNSVYEAHGNSTGDALLRNVALTFTKHLRETDIIGRIETERFAILLTNPDGQKAIENVVFRLISELGRPVNIHGQEVKTRTAIGISVFPDNGGRQEDLVKKAELALNEAKKDARSRHSFRYYKPSMMR